MRAVHFLRTRFHTRRGDTRAIQNVRIIAHEGNELLLVQHWYAPGIWTLPGGRIEMGESPRAGARRELCEETAYRLSEEQLQECSYLYTEQLRTTLVSNKTAVFSVETKKESIPRNREIMKGEFFSGSVLPDRIHPLHKKLVEQSFI